MMSVVDRVFTDQELKDAGEPTVDAIERCLQLEQFDEAMQLVDRFQLEILTMFYSYQNWENSVLDTFAVMGGEPLRSQVLAAIEDAAAAPERLIPIDGVEPRWNGDLEAIKASISAESQSTACQQSRDLRQDALSVHDRMMSRITAMLTRLYEDFGETALTGVLHEVMRPELMDPDGNLPFREKVEQIIHFNRTHFQKFTLLEDDEKVTFMPHPCGSGERLIREGHYEAPRGGTRVRGPGPLTYGRKDLPVYCCHEPAMEMSSILRTGVPIFIVEPPADVGFSPCKIYVYKNPADIPEAYYKRLGLQKPEDLIAIAR